MQLVKHGKILMRTFLLCLLLLVGLPWNGQAAEPVSRDESPLLTVTAGTVNLLDAQKRGYLGLEYRFRPLGEWSLRPTVSAGWAADTSRHISAGLKYDFLLNERWFITPGFAVLYFEDGEVLKLGHSIEFKSELELSYRFPNQSRLGLAYFHISNGGMSDSNPGTDALALSLSLPLSM